MIIDNELKDIILNSDFRGAFKDSPKSISCATFKSFKIKEEEIGVNNIKTFHYTFDEFLRIVNFTYSLSNFLLLMNIKVNAGTYIWTSAKMEFYYMGEVLSKYYVNKKDYDNFTKLNRNYRKIDSYFTHLINYNEALEKDYKIIVEASIQCREKDIKKNILNKEKMVEEVLHKNHFILLTGYPILIVDETLVTKEKYKFYVCRYTMYSKTLTPARVEKVINIFKGQGYHDVAIKATSFGEQFGDISI